jgi:hypothetical protein
VPKPIDFGDECVTNSASRVRLDPSIPRRRELEEARECDQYSPNCIAACFLCEVNPPYKVEFMKKRALYIVVSLAIITIAIGLASCRNSEDGALTPERGTTEIRQCRAGSARPITVMTAMRVIRHYGFSVKNVPDADICNATDTIAVFDNTETKSYDVVLNTEGHIRCGLRKKPIYGDHTKIVSSEYANWNELRYENLECGLERNGAGATNNRREKFREIFDQLRRQTKS